jgi:hypothetical protein
MFFEIVATAGGNVGVGTKQGIAGRSEFAISSM